MSESKRASTSAAAKPKDKIKMYLNPESFDVDKSSKKNAILNYLTNVVIPKENQGSDFSYQGTRIRQATEDKAGSLGLCYGVLTRSWLNVERTDKEDIILIVESPLPSRHGSMSFSAFAAIKIIEEPSGTYLYLDGLCSNKGKAGLVMDYMLKTIGGPLLDLGMIQGFKLSGLGYVVGYYYKKYGYKFYDTVGDQLVENRDLNKELKQFTNYVFTSDVEDDIPEDFIDTEEMSNWFDAMTTILSEDEYKTIIPRLELKQLTVLSRELEKLTKNEDRRATLPGRIEIVRQIQTIVKNAQSSIDAAEESNITPIMRFFLKARKYTANPDVRIMSRGRTSEEMADQAIRQDLTSDGFYMYYIPERREESSAASKEDSPLRLIKPSDDAFTPKPKPPGRRSRTRRRGGGRKKRKKTRRKFRKKSKKRKKTRRRRKVKKTRKRRKR